MADSEYTTVVWEVQEKIWKIQKKLDLSLQTTQEYLAMFGKRTV